MPMTTAYTTPSPATSARGLAALASSKGGDNKPDALDVAEMRILELKSRQSSDTFELAGGLLGITPAEVEFLAAFGVLPFNLATCRLELFKAAIQHATGRVAIKKIMCAAKARGR